MITPLTREERERTADVAAKVNEVIAVVKGLLGEGVEVEFEIPQAGGSETMQIAQIISGRLRLLPGGTP